MLLKKNQDGSWRKKETRWRLKKKPEWYKKKQDGGPEGKGKLGWRIKVKHGGGDVQDGRQDTRIFAVHFED